MHPSHYSHVVNDPLSEGVGGEGVPTVHCPEYASLLGRLQRAKDSIGVDIWLPWQ